MDRRSFLSASAIAAAAPLIGAAARGEEAPPATASKPPTRVARLASAIADHRMPIDFDGRTFRGPGYDWLFQRGAAAYAFLIGEEHGISENPKLAAQLFAALVPKGYRNVAIEISPPMAAAVDRALASSDPAALKHC